MSRTRPPYPKEFREQIVALAQSGRSPKELAEEFEPSEATIRHWLKQAEIEQSVLARQALSRRVPDRKSMTKLTTAWARRRNRAEDPVDWRFTTADARLKLKRLYPNVDA